MVNILFATIFDYPHEGGLSTHITTLKKGLEMRGHQVDIVSFSSFPSMLRTIYARVPGFLVNKWKKGKGQVYNDRNRKHLLSYYIKRRACKYDIVNAQDIYATLATSELGIPTVATVHGYFSYEAISRGAIIKDSAEDYLIRQLEQGAYQQADEVVAVDRRIRDYIKGQSSVDAVVIKNFIDVDSFCPQDIDTSAVKNEFSIPHDFNILFVPRRLTEKNGVIYPVLALQNVIKKHPNTLLVYAGTGEQMPVIKKLVSELNLHNQVKLLGSVPHEKMKELYGISDIVLIPSVHSHGVEEATSISALEAMGSGAPVIAGAVGGLKEIIENKKDGLLVRERDVEELSSSILKLLEEPGYGDFLAKNARGKVEKEYSHLAAAEKFESIYLDVIRRRSMDKPAMF
ncbi:MAG TPA: glycosyltransferase family 4 protein [Metabacillus sp.]|nr:glycosyltransferase family 4 protein [Metabacillus sp.]